MMNRVARGLIDNVHLNRDRLVGHLYLGSTLTESVSRWPDNSPDNGGHIPRTAVGCSYVET